MNKPKFQIFFLFMTSSFIPQLKFLGFANYNFNSGTTKVITTFISKSLESKNTGSLWSYFSNLKKSLINTIIIFLKIVYLRDTMHYKIF